jgi:hypothetical protein
MPGNVGRPWRSGRRVTGEDDRKSGEGIWRDGRGRRGIESMTAERERMDGWDGMGIATQSLARDEYGVV